MKKLTLLLGAFLMSSVIFAQAVKDRNVIPVAVNLNQVLRMNITNGGNIEFTFNTIDQYKNGISGDQATSASSGLATSDPMYITDFTVASSTRWKLTYGAENATLMGTDDPAHTLDLTNVGFSLTSDGVHLFGTEVVSVPTADGTVVSALEQYPIDLIADADNATAANAGDALDNIFQMKWRCGTTEIGGVVPMHTQNLIDQQPTPSPDRYVVNVLFDLSIDE